MNFIAGYLLIVTKDEEKSFWLMEALLGRILPGVYLYLTFFCVHVCACTSSLRVIQSVTRFFKGEKKTLPVCTSS